MHRFVASVLRGAFMTAVLSFVWLPAAAQPAPNANPDSRAGSALPPPPSGKSTVLGGEIQEVNPVLDQLTLKVSGGHAVKVLFDARTKIYLDGKRMSLLDLHPENHASVQTVLDGNNIFAISIHMLSASPKGEYQGQVVSYDRGSGELTVSSVLSREPVRLRVPENTPVSRKGQASFASAAAGASDLRAGSLVAVDFHSDGKGHAVASHIDILATPGSAFVFSGRISRLNLADGTLVLVGAQDNRSYEVFFDHAQLQAVKQLHEGDNVSVTASFTGNRYTVSSIRTY